MYQRNEPQRGNYPWTRAGFVKWHADWQTWYKTIITGTSEKTIVIYASCRGDTSVGIPAGQAVMTIEERYLDGFTRENRDWLRKQLIPIWSELFDEPAGIMFEGECPDCLEKLEECTCRCMNCGTLLLEHGQDGCDHFDLP